MNKRSFIFSSLLLVSIAFLISTWYLIVQDANNSRMERLEFYNHFLDNHRKWVITSSEQVAKAVVSSFIPKPMVDLSQDSEPFLSEPNQYGFSKIELYSPKASSIPTPGLYINNDSVFYRIVMPVSNTTASDSLVAGFSFSVDQFNLNNEQDLFEDCEFSYLLTIDSASVSLSDHDLFKLPNLNRHFYGFHFSMKDQLLNDSRFVQKMEAFLQPNSDLDSFSTNSFIHRLNGKTYVFSLIQIDDAASTGSAYLLYQTQDPFFDKITRWEMLFIVVNCLVILIVWLAMIYFYRNLLKINQQKKIVQESELKLLELNASKDKFYSIIAHDLKNPFNGIMGLSSYLYEAYDDVNDEEILDVIHEINLASRNAFNLLQNLLEWTRSQTGTLHNLPVRIEPNEVIELALETVWPLARNKEILIQIKIETNYAGYADQNMVCTVIRNLVTNAVKFSPRTKPVYISVTDYKNELVFCFKDEGVGMRSDEIDQLFRIDLNFHKKGTEHETGSGLGLKLCNEFVRKCGGKLWVISTPGAGSSFYFTIPLYRKLIN